MVTVADMVAEAELVAEADLVAAAGAAVDGEEEDNPKQVEPVGWGLRGEGGVQGCFRGGRTIRK